MPARATGVPCSVAAATGNTVRLGHADSIGAGQWQDCAAITAGSGPFRVTLTTDAHADLFVRRGAMPDAAAHDCRLYLEGAATEACELAGPGSFSISENGYDPLPHYQLTVEYVRP